MHPAAAVEQVYLSILVRRIGRVGRIERIERVERVGWVEWVEWVERVGKALLKLRVEVGMEVGRVGVVGREVERVVGVAVVGNLKVAMELVGKVEGVGKVEREVEVEVGRGIEVGKEVGSSREVEKVGRVAVDVEMELAVQQAW